MDNHESRFAPSTEAASDDFASPIQPSPALPDTPPAAPDDALYWRGVADGIARAGGAVPPEIAARAGAGSGPAEVFAFDPVPLRFRSDGLTPERQRAFIEALADCGVVREAAARIGVSEQAVNQARRRADARSFDLACEAAHRFGARGLRSVAFERAILGTIKRHYYHGELKSEERVYDNRLLIYLLAKTEHLLQPPEETRTICDNWDSYMDALERGLPPPDATPPNEVIERVWKEDDGEWRTSFPPPVGFDGYEEGVCNGVDWYCRALTPREQAAVEARERDDVAQERARRDRFFGFAGDRISSPMGPETSESSEPHGGWAGPPVARSGESSILPPDTHSEGGSG